MGEFKLSVKNFQSISNAELTFNPGITMIVGQSNSGKTALFRALDGLLTNPSKAKYRIKHGTNELAVTCEYDNNAIEWTRNAKSGSSYVVNGEKYEKIGTQDLFDILEANGFVRDWNDNIMNIEGEWNLPFPFDRTPGELFRLFENVLCVTDSATILKSYKEDELEASRAKTALQDKGKGIQQSIQVLDDLEKEVDLQTIKDKARKFEKHITRYTQSSEDIKTIKHCAKAACLNLDEKLPPEEYSLTKYSEMYKDLTELQKVLALQEFDSKLPEVLEVPRTLDDYDAMVADLADLKLVVKLNRFTKSLPAQVSISITLDTYDEMVQDLADIQRGFRVNEIDLGSECVVTEGLITSYNTMVEDLELIKRAQEADNVSLPDEDCELCSSDTLKRYLEMSEDYANVYSIYQKCKELKHKIKESDTKIEELEAKLSEYKICPLCGHELNGEHTDE
jgi:DNA repair exonuclease SbcCD ATPase subunit